MTGPKGARGAQGPPVSEGPGPTLTQVGRVRWVQQLFSHPDPWPHKDSLAPEAALWCSGIHSPPPSSYLLLLQPEPILREGAPLCWCTANLGDPALGARCPAECPLQEPRAEKLQLPNPVARPHSLFPLWFPMPLSTPASQSLGPPEGPRDSGAVLFSHREPPDSPELLVALDPQAPM